MPEATTMAQLFLDRVSQTPEDIAFDYPVATEWRSMRWREVGARVRGIASGLRALGLEDEQRCAIVSGTRMDWILADFAILCAGGATTTIYPSSTAEDCAYILQDSETVFVFAENEEQVEKLWQRRSELPKVKKVISFEPASARDGWVLSLAELESKGRAADAAAPANFEGIARRVRKDSLATLIYTSGTTGKPKGVELIHDCWVYAAEGIDGLGILRRDDVQYLWLPLAHSFGKVLESAQLRIGFRTAVDGRVDKLVENLAVVRPTFVAAVPRIFEKVHNKVVGQATQAGGVKLKIFRWAMEVGRKASQLIQKGGRPAGLLALQYAIASRLVFSKLQARFGGRLRFFISGSAPLSRELAEFFHAAGILILEGYGLTESSAGSFVNTPSHFKFGTVGPPIPGTQVKIAPADGEILIKSRGVMRGYHHLPEATQEALDADGWLHTGDIGELDDGKLRITDRKKELIKTSGGKYVSPQGIEGKFKALCPVVSQILVHGNNRNYCSALITLDEEAIRAWAKDQGVAETSVAGMSKNEKVRALIEGYVEELNKQLASYETIKKFAILPNDFTLEAGEITPSLKLKRKVVEKKYEPVLEGFYAGAVAKL